MLGTLHERQLIPEIAHIWANQRHSSRLRLRHVQTYATVPYLCKANNSSRFHHWASTATHSIPYWVFCQGTSSSRSKRSKILETLSDDVIRALSTTDPQSESISCYLRGVGLEAVNRLGDDGGFCSHYHWNLLDEHGNINRGCNEDMPVLRNHAFERAVEKLQDRAKTTDYLIHYLYQTPRLTSTILPRCKKPIRKK